MTLYLGINLKTAADQHDKSIVIEGHEDLSKYGFSPIHSSTQAVARDANMPAPGESTSLSQQGIFISPYHITKPHNWSSRYFENTLFMNGNTALDFVIVSTVDLTEGLAPLFIKYITGAHISSLTREIDSLGKMSETITFVFQKMRHVYFEVSPEGVLEEIESFDFDLNTLEVGSAPETLNPTKYGQTT